MERKNVKKTIKLALLSCLVLTIALLALTSCDSLDEKCAHVEVIDKAVTPTCTETGLTKGSHCSLCNEVIVEQKVIAAFGHTEATNKAVEPTCSTEGLTEGKYCSICSEVIVPQESVKALEHTEVTIKGKDPTCSATGLTDGKKCSVCNKILVPQETVKTLSHTEVTIPGKAASCSETGLTDGKKCSVCNETLVNQKVIEKSSHTEVIDKGYAATCTVDGLTDGKHCSVCNETIVAQEVITAEHTLVTDIPVAPTCTETGLTLGKHCSVCGEVEIVQSTIPAAGHTWDEWYVTVDPTENTSGTKCRDCKNCDESETAIVPPLDHDCSKYDTITVEAKSATCTEPGNTEGKKCSSCQAWVVEPQTIPAKGHTEVEDKAVEPTCTTDGLTKGVHCSVCNTVILEPVVRPAAHKPVNTEKSFDATCTETGLKTGTHCYVCKVTLTESEVIPALGHDTKNQSAKTPTCTEAGWDAYEYCSRCDYTTYVEKAKLGHDAQSHDAKAPTCTEIGWDAYETCSRCSYSTYKEKGALGHDIKNQAAGAATCTKAAHDAYKYCSRCDYSTYVPKGEPLGHSNALVYDSQAQLDVYRCTRCAELPANVHYEDYGAKGDGVTDDADAIRKAHKAANHYGLEYGLEVEGNPLATYYIGAMTETIPVKTNTNWQGAKFIFDDSQIYYKDCYAHDEGTCPSDNKGCKFYRSVQVFTVLPDADYRYNQIDIPENLATNGLHKGATKIEGLNLTGPAMIEILNENERIFVRIGENADGGDAMQELIYVDKDGNIDPTTPVLYDYSTITRIRIYSVTDAPIKVGNAKIETRVPDPVKQAKDREETYDNQYVYYNRGILVQRANATVYDIDHSITGEDMSVIIDRDGDGQTGDSTSKSTSGRPEKWGDDKSYGVPYNGFFAFEESYNVTLDGCILQGHQAYNFYNEAGNRNEMGSYDLYGRHCIKFNLINLTQRENYGDYPSDTVITNRFMYHGVMGTYHCRNMVMDNCYLDRFDSHKGMHNARITNSTLGFGLLVIGGGELYVESVYRISEGPFILLREDYNSCFDGDIIIKNCTMGSSIKNIIGGNWYNDFYNGLDNHIVNNLTIDGLHSESEGEADWSNWGKKTLNIYLWSITERTSGKNMNNPICGLPANVKVRNVTSNAKVTNVKASSNSKDSFAKIGITTEWSD